MNHKWRDRRIAAPGPYITLCLNEQQFNKALRDCGIPAGSVRFLKTEYADATCHYLNNKRQELACIVCIGDYSKRNGIEIAGLLVHEAVHIWQQYASRIGEDSPGSEQEAYAIQSISQELMAEFARQAAST